MMSDVLRWVVPVPLALAVLVMQPPPQSVAKATTTELDSGGSTAKAINPGEVRVAGQRKSGGTSNSGVVYRLQQTGNQWTETILHNFTGGSDGQDPSANLLHDVHGNLLGMAQFGGTSNDGIVYQVKP